MKSSQTSTLSVHKANDDQVDDRSSDEEAFYSQSNDPSREDIDLPHGSQESKPNRDHRSSFPRRKKRDSLRGRLFSRDSRKLPDSSDRQENEIKDLENKVHSLRKEALECFSNLDKKLSCFEVKAVLTSTLSVHKASDNVDDRSSDEEIFYSQSKEPSREDIDLPHGSQESKPNRDHRSSLPQRQKRDILLRGRRDSRDEYSRQLLDSLDRQENEIKDLETEVRSLRKEVRERFSNMDEKLSGFEVKVDLIVNLVSSWFQHPFADRRCRGFCTKHVRTDKCLCRGLKEPHRCCGHISGLCDC